MTLLIDDDYTGTNGASWSGTYWTGALASGSGAVDIDTNRGRLHAVGAFAFARVKSNVGTQTDQEVLFSFDTGPSGGRALIVALRGDGNWRGSDNAVPALADGLSIDPNLDSYQLRWYSGASDGSHQAATSFTFADNTIYWCRMRYVGSAGSAQLAARIWADGGAEPGTWPQEITNAGIASGVLQLGWFSSSSDPGSVRTAYIDNLTYDDLAVPAASGGTRLWRPSRLKGHVG